MATRNRISPCLWFNDQAEEAARYYVGIFKNSRITSISRYGKAGFAQHHQPEGRVLTAVFDLDGQSVTALNGGPAFTFNEAVSLMVECDTQEEIDYFWEKLGAGGDPKARQCGWLKDKFGVSWQVVPSVMEQWFDGAPTPATERVMEAMMPMKKLDIAALKKAYDG